MAGDISTEMLESNVPAANKRRNVVSKFNPDDLKNPVYEYSQVVTIHDLRVIYSNLARQYNDSHWWSFRAKLNLMVAGHIMCELITWLYEGKPSLRK